MKLAPALLAAFLLAGCNSPAPLSMVSYTPQVQRISYYVGGTAESASVTYATGSGTSQGDVDLPMKNKNGTVGIQMTSADAPRFLYISAQNSTEYGSVTCRIMIDDETVAENTSTGAFKIASCKYSR